MVKPILDDFWVASTLALPILMLSTNQFANSAFTIAPHSSFKPAKCEENALGYVKFDHLQLIGRQQIRTIYCNVDHSSCALAIVLSDLTYCNSQPTSIYYIKQHVCDASNSNGLTTSASFTEFFNFYTN